MLWLPILLISLLSCTSATLEVDGVQFVNVDFWHMPNSYHVVDAPIVRATFLKDVDCRLDAQANTQGAVLYINFVRAREDHGCYVYHQVIAEVAAINPLVTVFASADPTEDFGSVFSEPYGMIREYQDSGLALTLVNRPSWERLEEIWDQKGDNLTVSITPYVGNWIVFRDTPGFKAFMGVLIAINAVFWLYITVSLIWKQKDEGFVFTLPVIIYYCCWMYTAFRILDLAIDSYNLFNRLGSWESVLLFWIGYVFGFAAYTLIGLSWVNVGLVLKVHQWQGKLATVTRWMTGFAIVFFSISSIMMVVTRAFLDSPTVVLAGYVFFIMVVPMLLLLTLVFLVSGIQILWLLHKNKTGTNNNAGKAFRNVTILMLCGVAGFVIIAAAQIYDAFPEGSIGEAISTSWVREFAGFWMMGSILISLNFHNRTSNFNAKTSGSTQGKEAKLPSSPSLALEHLGSQLQEET